MMERIQELEKLGVVRVAYDTVWEDRGDGRQQYELPDVVRGIRLSLTPDQWAAVAQREGSAYVGGCCGNMGAVQDIVCGVFRDDGWMESGDLSTVGWYSRGHEGMEFFEEVDDEEFAGRIEELQRAQQITEDGKSIVDPWGIIGLSYVATESKLKPSWLNQPSGRHPHDDDPPDHFEMQRLYRDLVYVDWKDLFGRVSSEDDKDKRSHDVQRRLRQARILPAARELVAKLEEQEIDFDGFALVKPGTDEILSNRLGDCIYSDREGAEEVLAIWRRSVESEDEGTTGHAVVAQDEGEIVPVRVTVENGLEVLRG